MTDEIELEYVGFWLRVWAMLIDTALLMIALIPLRLFFLRGERYSSWDAIGGAPADLWLSVILPAVAALAFWTYRQATPGKMAIGARIVCAKTGGTPSLAQFIIRYLAYSISTAVFMLGWLWVAFDSRKQGWHDKLAGTVVVRRKSPGVKAVEFER
jgi:uncharacterized RDD family membrane protein YckC